MIMGTNYFWFTEFLHLVTALGVISWFKYTYKKTNIWLCIMIGLGFGFFIDIDHVIDYAMYFLSNGHYFTLTEFIRGGYFETNRRIYVLFHAWEFVIILWLVYKLLSLRYKKDNRINLLLLAALAILGHLVVDQLTNGVSPLFYFISYRAINGFGLNI